MKFRAVLFDLDGTLLDTIDDLADSMNVALASLGYSQRSVEECKVFVGDGVETFARRALPPEAAKDEIIVRDCVAAMRKDYANRWAAKTRPYEGIPELLDELVRRGLRLAVLSNKPDDFTKLMIARMLPRWLFEAVVGARKNVAKKPDPAAAVGIARLMSLQPAEILYLGDTNTDMRTAVAAGMFAVGAAWGFRTREELLSSGARGIAESPSDVLEILG